MTRWPTRINYGTGAQFKVRIVLSMFRLTGNTQGHLLIEHGSSSDYFTIDVTQYNTNEWSYLEFPAVVFTSTSKGTVRPKLRVSSSTPLAGAGVLIAEFRMFPDNTAMGVPQKTASSAYTLKALDNGKHIYISTGGVTIPNDADGWIPNDSVISIINNSGSDQTISKGGSVTLYLSGDNTSQSSLTLAARGIATAVKVGNNVWIVAGDVSA